MRTEEIKIYQFHELSDAAKQVALDAWGRDGFEADLCIQEAHESFKLFAEIFSIKWTQMDYEESYRSEYRFRLEDEILELSGQRLATYIWNNYKHDIFNGKYYGRLTDTHADGSKIEKSEKHPIGQRHLKRHSNCQMENCCVLTGVCYDDDLLDPMYKFLEKPSEMDFRDLLEDCIHSLQRSVQSEIEARNTDEAIAETIEANEYEFYENGERY